MAFANSTESEKAMSGKVFKTFSPDLIIEATSVCDRACPGCYAPNLLSKKKPAELYASDPGLFIEADTVAARLLELSHSLSSVAIRGGEPTLHPKIIELLEAVRPFANEVYLETHGRWILPESLKPHRELIKSISSLGIIIKLSFDKMHGLTSQQLRTITDFMDWFSIRYCIAITELDEPAFEMTRSLCSWVKDQDVIFQKKAFNVREMVQPKFGVIGVSGSRKSNLTTKAEFSTGGNQGLSASGRMAQ